jgi:SOS regulatory protein LexA
MDTHAASLTGKQIKFFETLKRYMAKHKESPTVDELIRLTKSSSPRAVTQYLGTLERKGLIRRERYKRRGIELCILGNSYESETVSIPVIASAGCDNMNIFAEERAGEYLCVSNELVRGKNLKNIACIKAIGDSMNEAGINEGDHVLVEMTQAIMENDLIVAVIDGFAVIKKIEYANNAVILRPISSDPSHKPIILRRDFNIFGKVIDVIRAGQRGDVEIVPLYAPR